MRDGQGQATNKKDADTLDCVITNALIIDWSGIYKVSTPFTLSSLLTKTLTVPCVHLT